MRLRGSRAPATSSGSRANACPTDPFVFLHPNAVGCVECDEARRSVAP